MSDKVPIRPKYKPRRRANLRETCRDDEFDPFIKPRLGFSPRRNFTRQRGMAVSSGREEMARKRAPPQNGREGKRGGRERKKEHDIAAFIKLNVSFPDKAFPEGTLLSGQLPPHSFLPSWKRES